MSAEDNNTNKGKGKVVDDVPVPGKSNVLLFETMQSAATWKPDRHPINVTNDDHEDTAASDADHWNWVASMMAALTKPYSGPPRDADDLVRHMWLEWQQGYRKQVEARLALPQRRGLAEKKIWRLYHEILLLHRRGVYAGCHADETLTCSQRIKRIIAILSAFPEVALSAVIGLDPAALAADPENFLRSTMKTFAVIVNEKRRVSDELRDEAAS